MIPGLVVTTSPDYRLRVFLLLGHFALIGLDSLDNIVDDGVWYALSLFIAAFFAEVRLASPRLQIEKSAMQFVCMEGCEG